MQVVPGPHWAGRVQVEGQVLAPAHRYGPHAEDEVPDASRVHVPAVPPRLQASQPPAHALPQQVELAQNPEAHWFAPAQTAPEEPLGTQEPTEHQFPAEHWASAEQLVGHTAVEPVQTNGAQAGFPAPPTRAQVPLTAAP